MSSKSVPTGELKTIKFKEILLPDDFNVRSDLDVESEDIRELGEDLKENGQITPLVVSNGGTAEQPYVLRAGFRRAAAYVRNRWRDRDVDVNVRTYVKGDHLGPIVDNYTENVRRKEISPIDLAQLLQKLTAGTYWVPEGETPEPVSKEIICKRFRMTEATLYRYLKLVRNLDPEVAEAAKKTDVPLRVLLPLTHIAGDGEDKEEQLKSRAKKQSAVLENWQEQQKALEKDGRQRRVRADKGKSKKTPAKDEEESVILRSSKKIDDKGRTVEDYLVVLMAARKTAKGMDAQYLRGMQDVLRFLTGDLGKFPRLLAADFEVLATATGPEAEE